MITKHFWKNFELRVCKKGGSAGGSAGGGGGGSGVVDYPAHMKTWHSMALDHTGVDTLTSSMTDIMNVAFGADPFTGENAYVPDTELAAMLAKITSHEAVVNALDESVDWLNFAGIASGTVSYEVPVPAAAAEIDADVTAFGDQLDLQLNNTVYPRFESGMRDINAVVSSAFAIGKGVIEEGRDAEVAKHASGLRIKAFMLKDTILADATKDRNTLELNLITRGASDMLVAMVNRVQFQQGITHLLIETNRLKIVAKKEQTDTDLDIDESAATWDINVFQHGANLLASIGGGTLVPDEKKKSVLGSTIGGALSGAAMGAIIGSAVPGIGTGVGALAGGLLGAASGFL